MQGQGQRQDERYVLQFVSHLSYAYACLMDRSILVIALEVIF